MAITRGTKNELFINDNDVPPYENLTDLLPLEMLVKIIDFIDKTGDIKNIKLSSKALYDACRARDNTFFGKSIRFRLWQQRKINKFEEEVDAFKKDYQVTVFNRPNQDFGSKIVYFAIVFLLLSMNTYTFKTLYDIFSRPNNGSTTDRNVSKDGANAGQSMKFLILLLGMTVITMLIIAIKSVGRLHNIQYQASHATEEHRDRVIQMKNEFLPLLTTGEILSMFSNAPTLRVLTNQLEHKLTQIKSYAKTIEDYAEQQRFSTPNDKIANPFDTAEKTNLTKYTQRMWQAWQKLDGMHTKHRESKLKLKMG